ncbi:MAG: 8-amino-7-oxononanoate synthase [Alphaproteobacteria bacterium]|nr:8-amino-7-oxononanoate synthase [Alphaproteobacteria bacterium]
MQFFAPEIEKLRRMHRHRTLALPSGLDFTSNDYLGLSRHPALREAIIAALDDDGFVGAGGSRLLRGHHRAHERLEAFAAQFFGAEKALYFGSGFLANFALFSTLPERHDAVIFDERIHASVKEGVHASPAPRYKATHNDVASFEAAMARARGKGAKRIFVAVESIYSMDGDLAPLIELDVAARKFGAVLIVDEAHATGVFGPRGRGLSEGLQNQTAIAVHTCGKALGVAGALVTGPAETIDYLINKARPFIYSTAPPPMLAAAVERALRLVNEEPWRRARVLELARFAHGELCPDGDFTGSQIVPVILGSEERTLYIARALQEQGFDVRAIRPPTVPEGTSRLRVSINAGHNEDQIAALAGALRGSMAR